MNVGRAVGWLAWMTSVALFGLTAYRLLESWNRDDVVWGVILIARALVGLVLHTRRRPEGLIVLGGCAIGWTASAVIPARDVHIALYILALALASLGHRLLRSDEVSPIVRTSLLGLSSAAVLLSAGLAWDLFLLRENANDDWLDAPSVYMPRLGLELACTVALVSFARGRTRGLLGYVVSFGAWLFYGAWVPAAAAVPSCFGTHGHPFALGSGTPALIFGLVAVTPWAPSIARFLRPPSPR